jgi:hypothetical protein
MDRCEYDWRSDGLCIVTRPRQVPKTKRGPKATVRRKPIEHSLYFGRERLGRYVQTGPKKYKAFDANDRPLGNFRVRARMLAAIRRSARR